MKKNNISIFETPIAILNLSDIMNNHILSSNPWELEGGQITMEELSDFIENNKKRVESGIYGDTAEFSLSNLEDCSREDHLARIAWLIDNWNNSELEPLEMESTFNEDEISNGYHRAFAAHYKGIKEIRCKYLSGHSMGYPGANILPIHDLKSFIKWETKPTGTGFFGENIISCGDEFYEVQKNIREGKVWVNDKNGMCLARFKNKGPIKSIEYTLNNSTKVLTGEDVNIKAFRNILLEISPLLDNINASYFSDIENKEKKRRRTFRR